MESLKRFIDDEQGTTQLVIRLVLAVTIAAAVITMILQMMHVNYATAKNASADITSGAKKGLEEGMRQLTDQ